jgi:16S rRNA (adenine1518-N6/adenine1519-N6)-dimethyltransferase
MPAAQRHHAGLTNVTWLNADVLAGKHEINPDVIATLRLLHASHPAGDIKLVSNLPYNAASPIIAEILVLMCAEQNKSPLNFGRLAFTVQWEVAQRMAAKPDTSDYGPLTIIIQLLADVEIVRKIPPGAFWPPPKIHSGLVVVTPSAEKMRRVADPHGLQKLITGIFSHRRQTLHNALRHHLEGAYTPALQKQIAEAGIDITRRPEVISPELFLKLSDLAAQQKAGTQ